MQRVDSGPVVLSKPRFRKWEALHVLMANPRTPNSTGWLGVFYFLSRRPSLSFPDSLSPVSFIVFLLIASIIF